MDARQAEEHEKQLIVMKSVIFIIIIICHHLHHHRRHHYSGHLHLYYDCRCCASQHDRHDHTHPLVTSLMHRLSSPRPPPNQP